jgi:hypothetical protein
VPSNPSIDLGQLSGVILAVISIVGATFTAVWLSLIIWTYRDMRSRSRDVFAQILAALVVAVLSIPGLLVYLILRPRETLAEQYERALEEEALLQEIEEKKVCTGCSHSIKDGWILCPFCHTKLKKPCQNCGQLLELPWSICPYCEQPQAERVGNSRRGAIAAVSQYDQASYPDETFD